LSFALNRANSVYLCVFAGFLIGIWVILDLGSAFLTAPRDLSGRWQLVNTPATIETPAAFSPASFSIAQSGRYLRFAFDHGPSLDLVLAESTGNNNQQTLTFQGQGWNVTGTGPLFGDSLSFTFQPPPSSRPSPSSGTYQRERMGQEDPPQLQSTAPKPPPSSLNAPH
jgi:hypothetical protein